MLKNVKRKKKKAKAPIPEPKKEEIKKAESLITNNKIRSTLGIELAQNFNVQFLCSALDKIEEDKKLNEEEYNLMVKLVDILKNLSEECSEKSNIGIRKMCDKDETTPEKVKDLLTNIEESTQEQYEEIRNKWLNDKNYAVNQNEEKFIKREYELRFGKELRQNIPSFLKK